MQQDVNLQNNTQNCKNCGANKDIYRTSCIYCNTYYDDNKKNKQLINDILLKPVGDPSGIGVFFR